MARAFSLGGDVTEDGWRAAARVRLIFLQPALAASRPAKAPAEEVFAGLPRSFWQDGDARWLMRVHESGGKEYFNKELHEQILWWTHLPQLLLPLESKAALEQRIQEAVDEAERAKYRVIRNEEAGAKPAPVEKEQKEKTDKDQEKKALTT
jgi:hypothetical protein